MEGHEHAKEAPARQLTISNYDFARMRDSLLEWYADMQRPFADFAQSFGSFALAATHMAVSCAKIAAQAGVAAAAMTEAMNSLMLKALEKERKNLDVDWEVAARVMEPALTDLKAEGFSRNIRMDAIHSEGALGEKVCVGYRVSAFNGMETKTKTVLFPQEIIE